MKIVQRGPSRSTRIAVTKIKVTLLKILRTRLNVLHWPINRLCNTPDVHSLTSHFTSLP